MRRRSGGRVGVDPRRGCSVRRDGIVVWTDRTDTGDHLMIARADGSHRRSLTPVTPDEGDIDAQVSPDGRWVMYEHDTPQTSTVRLVRPDGTGTHDIPLPCTGPCIGISGGPTWLTNHRIAYVVVNGPIDATATPPPWRCSRHDPTGPTSAGSPRRRTRDVSSTPTCGCRPTTRT